jgi:hypothetical protein
MSNIPPSDRRDQSGRSTVSLPWVERLAQRLVNGERIALRELDGGEVLAVLRVALKLVGARTRRRPRARRRAA